MADNQPTRLNHQMINEPDPVKVIHPPIQGELPTNTDRLETLLKNLPGMAYRCLNLPHWPMDFVSDGCFELCGYQRSEIESQSILWGDFTHPDDLDFVDQTVRNAADEKRPFEVEYRIITRDKSIKWIWERGRAVDVRSDGVAIIEGFITDITDRKLFENGLKQAEAFSQAVVDSAVEAVITIDREGNIESINKAAESMFNLSLAGDGEFKCSRLIPTKLHRAFQQYFDEIKSDQYLKKNSGIEIEAVKTDRSEFPSHLTINQIQKRPTEKYIVLFRDLTPQKAVEQEAREQRELLAHVDRLNTLGEMAAGIAHEINQPLTAISMYAKSSISFLESKPMNCNRLKEALDKLSTQAHRAGMVIERMQQLTKQRESRHEITDCLNMIREIQKLAEVEAKIRNIDIQINIEDPLPKVTCDPIQIQQVILNLLRNGMEAMERNHQAKNCVVLSAKNADSKVYISIEDSGSGISEELEQRLYQPFTSTKESGMGLGLSISRSIISAHGGRLEFFNNDHGGATFYFSLPATTEQD